MIESAYDKDTKMLLGYPKIRKLGAVSPNGESSPFVWNGKLMRLELEDAFNATNPDEPVHALIRERDTGKVLSRFGLGCYYYSLYIEDGVAYVLGTKSDYPRRSGHTILLYESRDLVEWSCRELLSNPGWRYYNTALTKGPHGYVLLMESDHPQYCGVPFTFFFATSPDMVNWTHMDPSICYTKERYNGGPWMKYSNGWYYVISVTELPGPVYTSYISRTKDFVHWELGKYNPIMMPSEEDRIISPIAADMSAELLEGIKTAFNINISDLDMCEYEGKTLITYNAGNQLGFYYLLEAEYDGPLDKFLEHFFM